MALDQDALHRTQRIRYEAFSTFATALNNCDGYEAMSGILGSQLKFIFDCFIFRIYYRNQQTQMVFQGFMGRDTFFQAMGQASNGFERKLVEKGLPVSLCTDDDLFDESVEGTIFTHNKVRCVSALPLVYPDGHEILISIASKDTRKSVELDFKFLKLVADLVSNKLHQLALLEEVAGKNLDLEVKNKQVTTLNRYLEKMVSQRTAELSEANHELATLFYRSSHDFRAPLANIMGLANVARLMTDDEEILSLFEQCRTVVNDMDTMLRRLDYLSSLHLIEKTDDINLEDLLLGLKDRYREKLDACGGNITINVGALKPYRSNAGVLTTVFQNLLDNSLTYHKGQPQISIDAEDAGDQLVIRFADNGQGIGPLILPKVFDMYYRGNALSTGHGLGLYMVRKLLKALNGVISAWSEEGQYSMFTIKLHY